MTEALTNHRLDLAYDGTRYHGWQIQPRVITVQGVIQDALTGLYGEPVSINGSGRTDAGVHALRQVANYRMPARVPLDRLKRVLNFRLPPDIRVLRVAEMPDSFHARKSAISKIYRYQLALSPLTNPFLGPYITPWQNRLNLAEIIAGARLLIGRHDFTSFCAHAEPDKNHIRRLKRCDVTVRNGIVYFRLEADGFLQHMVRNIVGTLLQIGGGSLPASAIPDIIQARDRSRAGPTAPARGLFMMRARYPRHLEPGGKGIAIFPKAL